MVTMMETKRTILHAAHSLFLEKGYERVTLREIAERSGVAKGGIFHHFDTKEKLFAEVISEISGLMDRWLEISVQPEAPVSETIRRMFESVASMSEEHFARFPKGVGGIEHYALLFDALRMFPELAGAFFQSYAGILARMREIVDVGKIRGELKEDLDPEVLAFMIGSLIEGASLIAALDPSVDLQEMMSKLFEMTWDGIGA